LLTIRACKTKTVISESKIFFEEMERMFFELMDSQSKVYRLPDVAREMEDELPKQKLKDERLQRKLQVLLGMADRRIFPALDDIRDILE
jgi:hypothetical protein